MVTGVGSDGSLVMISDTIEASSIQITNTSLIGAKVRVQPTVEDAWMLFVADGQGPLRVWSASNTGSLSGPVSVELPTSKPAVDVLFTTKADGDQGIPVAVVADSEDNLFSYAAVIGELTPLGTSPVVAGAGTTDAQNLTHFYWSDPDGNLWVLHQTGWDPTTGAVWAPSFPLDQDVTFVATPALAAAAPAIIAARVDNSIDLLSQPGGAGFWNRVPVQGPTTEIPFQTTRYRTRVSLSDDNAAPCPGTQIQVVPSALVALEVAGQTVIASPDAPAVLTADLTSAVEFTQPATGLDAVTFTVTPMSGGSTQPLNVTPYDYVQQQLAGTSTVNIFTGSSTISPMSPQMLQGAKWLDTDNQSHPVFPTITAAQAQACAPAISSLFQVLSSTNPPSDTGYELDLSDPLNPQFTPVQDTTELGDRLAALRTAAAAGTFGDFFGDILHGIKQGVLKVVKWVVKTAEKVVSIVVEITETVTTFAADLLIDSIEAVVSLAHGIFGWLGAPVAIVLNWLKDLLPWNDIWATMETFNTYFVDGISGLLDLEHKAAIATGHFFSDLKSTVDQWFSTMINQIDSQQQLRPSSPVIGSDMPPAKLPGSDAQNNWFKSKLTTHLPGTSAAVLPDPGTDGDDLITQIKTAIDNSGIVADLQTELANVKDFYSALFHHPPDVQQVLAVDLIKVVQGFVDIVLDAMDALVQVLLDIVGDAVTAMTNVLTGELGDIPFLSWLWTNVLAKDQQDQTMTLAKLACLVMAVPVTLLSRIAPLSSLAADSRSPQTVTAADGNGLVSMQFYSSLLLAAIDATNDFANAIDAEAQPDHAAAVSDGETDLDFTLIWNAVDFVANAVVQGLFQPDIDTDWSSMTKGQALANSAQLAYWAPIAVDGVFTAWEMGAVKLGKADAYEALAGNLVTILDCVLGVLLMGVGVAGTAMELHDDPPNAKWYDVLEALLNPMPWATQFTVLEPAIVESDFASVAIQIIIDFLGDIDFTPGYSSTAELVSA
jgi:hypothetical protein